MKLNRSYRSLSVALTTIVIFLALGCFAIVVYQSPDLADVGNHHPASRAASNLKSQEIKLADSATLLTKPGSISFVEYRERDNAKIYLSRSQYDAALSAAKAYYCVAELSKTPDAVKLIARILTKARGKKVCATIQRGTGPSDRR